VMETGKVIELPGAADPEVNVKPTLWEKAA